MHEKFQKPELLAPAGNVACLKAAFIAGADAVYLSGKRFGARAFAGNFDEKSLRWARRVTVALNKKMYITLNTIVFEKEWKLLEETLDFYERLQPDALIIQDIGVARELKNRQSGIPLHLSTQAAWFGIGAFEELKELGISRVILPRELSLDEVKNVASRFPELELEIFVHGAMCYSISGKCYWSIALGTRSGNRGTCAQPCRREYTPDGEDCMHLHPFSPRDLRLIGELEELKKAGVVSLKIEGRMKGPEYVYQVVKAYRKAIDEGCFKENRLDEVYSRASTDGFIHGRKSAEEWRTPQDSGREGVIVGRASGEYRDGLVGIFATETISPGEGIFWYDRGQKKGARVTWVKKDRKIPGLIWVRGLSGSIKKNTEVRRSSRHDEGEWEKLWNRDWERRPVDLFWSGREGSPLAVETVLNGHPLRIETEEKLQLALNIGLEEGPLQEKFDILGDYFKAARHVTTLLGKGLHISARTLKKLKRTLVESLLKFEQLPPPREQKIPGGLLAFIPRRKRSQRKFENLFARDLEPEIYLRVWNHTFPFVRDIEPDCWVLPWLGNKSRSERIIHTRIAYWLPPVLNAEHFNTIKEELKRVENGEFFCMGWEAFELCRIFPDLKFVMDWSFNICNFSALNFMLEKNIRTVFSREWRDEDLPENLIGFRCLPAWNPLVSFSRFKNALQPGQMVQNSHNDRFFMLPIGNDISGLFLLDKPAAFQARGTSSLFMDIAISPEENPIQAAKDLNRMVDSFKSNRGKS
ncbi:MAG: hypothetical protein Kow0029_14940 [Candidatus Rifleibacteriota bacterium]